MINVVIRGRLYGKDFVNQWTVGFDKLKAHVQDYSPEKASEITWIPSSLIEKAAALYATSKPGHVEWGKPLTTT